MVVSLQRQTRGDADKRRIIIYHPPCKAADKKDSGGE